MDIYQHFRKEERPLIDQVSAWREEVALKYQRKLSDFLNPREQAIVKAVLANDADVNYAFEGGSEFSERKRAIIAPEYEQLEPDDFKLTLLEAEYPQKFVQVEHPDVLGAFMSLGIRREKIGDVTVKDGIIQLVTASEISDYIKMNLTGIKRCQVSFEEKTLTELMASEETWTSSEATVSSLRLDVLVKEIYGMSRKKAGLLIEGGAVKVNFRTVDEAAFSVEEGDMLSLRGHGRSRLDHVMGKTKRGKYRIQTAKLN